MDTTKSAQDTIQQTMVCSKCKNTGYQVVKKDGIPYATKCDCGYLEREAMTARRKFCEIPVQYMNKTLIDFDDNIYSQKTRIKVAAVKWLNTNHEKGLFMFSQKKGSGKTLMASIIANALIEQGKQVKFTTSGRILSEIKSSWDKTNDVNESDLINQLVSAKILIIDDFGVEKSKDWINERFYDIINTRYINNSTTIYTSNYSVDDLAKVGYDERILSRIKETCYQIPFPEQSIRDKIADQNKLDLKALLDK